MDYIDAKIPDDAFEGAFDLIQYRVFGRLLDCHVYKNNQAPSQKIGEIYDFYKIWRNKFKGHVLPSWSDFSFEDFLGWHSNMRVIDGTVNELGKRRYIIVGDNFAKYWGNQSIAEHLGMDTPDVQETKEILDRHIKFLYDGNYMISIGMAPKKDSSNQSTMWIELPLINEKGNVTHFLNAVVPLEKKEVLY